MGVFVVLADATPSGRQAPPLSSMVFSPGNCNGFTTTTTTLTVHADVAPSVNL